MRYGFAAALLLAWLPLAAEPLPSADRAAIAAAAERLMQARSTRNAPATADEIFEGLILALGGRERYLLSLEAGYRAPGVSSAKPDVTRICTDYVRAGAHWVCDVRFALNGRAAGSMLAVRAAAGGAWTFIPGSALDAMPTLLPGLPRDYKPPP